MRKAPQTMESDMNAKFAESVSLGRAVYLLTKTHILETNVRLLYTTYKCVH